jgi:undecaprenyl-diphosphatase
MGMARPAIRLGFALAAFAVLETLLILFGDRSAAEAARAWAASGATLPALFRATTDIGLGQWYAWPSGIGTLIGLVLVKSRPAWRERLVPCMRRIAFFFVATSAAGLINDAVKYLVGRARPKLYFSEGLYTAHPFTHGYVWNSFPSGHTATMFAVAEALALLFPRLAWPARLLALWVGLSRIMVNAHYPSDVLAGALVGVLIVRFCARLAVFQTLQPVTGLDDRRR